MGRNIFDDSSSSVESGIDIFSSVPDSEPVAPPTILGEIPKGLKAGVQQLRGMGYGIGALAGEATESEPIKQWAAEGLQDVEAKTPQPAIASFSDIGAEGDYISDTAKYLAYGVASNLPNMVLSMGGGVAGALIGKKLVAEAAKAALTESAKKAIVDQAIKRGALSGAGLSSIGMEAGSIASDQLTETGQVDVAKALAGAIPAGMLDVIPEWYLAKRLGWLGKDVAKMEGNRAVRALKVAGQQFAMEAPTEAMQSVIERASVPGKSISNAEAWDEYINSFILGGVTGGVVGGAGGVFTSKKEDTPVVKALGKDPLANEIETMIAEDKEGSEAIKVAPPEPPVTPPVVEPPPIPPSVQPETPQPELTVPISEPTPPVIPEPPVETPVVPEQPIEQPVVPIEEPVQQVVPVEQPITPPVEQVETPVETPIEPPVPEPVPEVIPEQPVTPPPSNVFSRMDDDQLKGFADQGVRGALEEIKRRNVPAVPETPPSPAPEDIRQDILQRVITTRLKNYPVAPLPDVVAAISSIGKGKPMSPSAYFTAVTKALHIPNKYSYLAKIADKLGVTITITDQPFSRGVTNPAEYDSDNNSISINPSTMLRQEDYGNGFASAWAEELFVHEVIHSIVLKSKNWPATEKRLQSFWAEVKSNRSSAPDNIQFYFDHIDKIGVSELPSMVFSNPTFAQWLDSIPAEGVKNESKTLWGKLKDIILRSLETYGLPKSKLNEINELLDNLIPTAELEALTNVVRPPGPSVIGEGEVNRQEGTPETPTIAPPERPGIPPTPVRGGGRGGGGVVRSEGGSEVPNNIPSTNAGRIDETGVGTIPGGQAEEEVTQPSGSVGGDRGDNVVTPKEQKKYLISAIDEALKVAPKETEIFRKRGRIINREDTEGRNSIPHEVVQDEKTKDFTRYALEIDTEKTSTITIDVPDDGSFTIVNDKFHLEMFKKMAAKFPVKNNTLIESTPPTAVKPTGKRIAQEGVEYYNDFKPRDQKLVTSPANKDVPKQTPNYYDPKVGWYSNGHYAIKIKKPEGITYSDKEVDISKVIPTTNTIPATIVGEYHTGTGDSTREMPGVHIIAEDGGDVITDATLVDAVLTQYPNAKVFLQPETRETAPILFKDKGKPVAVVMPVKKYFDMNNKFGDRIAELTGNSPLSATEKVDEGKGTSALSITMKSAPPIPFKNLNDIVLSLADDPSKNKVVPKGLRISLENVLIAEIQQPSGELGGKVTQVAGFNIGEGIFEIDRPYGKLIYNEATGELSVSPTPIADSMAAESAKFGVDKTLLLQTLSKDIVNNDLPGTIANETIQNSLDAFMSGQTNKEIDIGIDTDYSTDVLETIITVTDNGRGMTASEVKKNLLRLGAKGKAGTTTRGGYGLAKAGFLLAPRSAEITTIKEGMMTVLKGTREQFFGVKGAGDPTIETIPVGDKLKSGTTFKLRFYSEQEDAEKNNAYALSSYNAQWAFDRYISKGIMVDGVKINYRGGYGQNKLIDTQKPSSLPQIYPKSKINLKGNSFTIYFVPATEESRKSWDGKYHPALQTFNKGLALFGIEKNQYEIDGMWAQPDWKVIVDFDKTPDVRDINYPFIRNRTSMNDEISKAVSNIVNEKIKSLNEKDFNLQKNDFANMVKNSPVINGIRVLIPFKDQSEFDKVVRLLSDNNTLISDLASIFNSFKSALGKIGGKDIDLTMTVDPKVHGYRSNPEIVGHEFYAINPFAVTGALELNPIFKELTGAGYDTNQAMASNLIHTFVHEYTHNQVKGHSEDFTMALGQNYMKLTHGMLSRLEQQSRRFYENHGEVLRSIQSDLSGMGKGGSRFQTDNINVYPSRTDTRGVEDGRGIQSPRNESAPAPLNADDQWNSYKGFLSDTTRQSWKSKLEEFKDERRRIVQENRDSATPRDTGYLGTNEVSLRRRLRDKRFFDEEVRGANQRGDRKRWQGVKIDPAFADTSEFKLAEQHFTNLGYQAVPISWVPWGGAVNNETKVAFIGEMKGDRFAYFMSHETSHILSEQGNDAIQSIKSAIDLTNPSAIYQREGYDWTDEYAREEFAASIVGGSVPNESLLKGNQDENVKTAREEAINPGGEKQLSPAPIAVAVPTFDSPSPTRMSNFIYTFIDKNIDLRNVVKAIRDAGNIIPESIDPDLRERLYSSTVSEASKSFMEKEFTPLLKKITSLKVDLDDFQEYLWFRTAKETNDYIATINPDLPDKGSGKSYEEIEKYFSELDPNQKAKYDQLAALTDSMLAKNRDLIVSYSLDSQATVDKWAETYPHYAPLFREDIETGIGTGQGFSVVGPSSRKRKGSTRPVVDILAHIAEQRERIISRGEKNRIATALVGLASAFPNPAFWKVIKTNRLGTYIAEGVIATVKDNVIEARIPDPETGEIKQIGVEFNTQNKSAERMVKSLKNIDMDTLGQILGMSAKITRYIASMNTQYNIVFGVVNFVRDFQSAMFNLSTTPIAGKQKEVAALALPMLKAIYTELRANRSGGSTTNPYAAVWEDFRKHGGPTGYRDLFRTPADRTRQIRRELDIMGSEKKFDKVMASVFPAARWLSDYNTAIENSIRLAAYKVAVDSGMSKDRAAVLAKNLTVDFNRKGQIATQAGALYAFFNASAQGSARMVETLMGPAGKKIIAGGITLGVMQAMALAAAGFGDDDPPEFVRERNIIIPTGGKSYITIPMPLGLHILPNIGRITAEWTLGGFKSPVDRMADLTGILVESFNPMGASGLSLQTITPTMIDPFAALAENKDWTGKPIFRENFSSLSPTPGFTRTKDTATWFSKKLSWAINLLSGGSDYKPGFFSPTADQIDFLQGQATGGVGREANKIVQMVQSLSGGEELPTYKIPLAGRFYGSTEGESNQATSFYHNLKKLNQHENEIKGRRKAGQPVNDYIQSNPEAKLWTMANKIESSIARLEKKRKALVDRDASKESIKTIRTLIIGHMKRLNEAVKKAEG